MEINSKSDVIFTFHAHYRLYDDKFKTDTNPNGIDSRGGCTVACIEIGNELHWAVARCNNIDVFSKRLGSIKAYGRARGSHAAITPKMDINCVKIVAEEFARVAINTKRDKLELFNTVIMQSHQVYNPYFLKLKQQQSLLI